MRKPKRIIPVLAWVVALAAILFSTPDVRAQTTNSLSEAEIEGRALAQKILAQQPDKNYTNTGVLEIRDASGKRVQMPVCFQVIVEGAEWQAIYSTETTNASPDDHCFRQVTVIHSDEQRNLYQVPNINAPATGTNLFDNLSGEKIFVPFASSDFWIADLGLEFFHWPQQKILPKTMNLKRGRDYTLLESTNPNPSQNGYSRVVSWIDKESDGILEAEAYDANGKALKHFEPKNLEKVDGQYQLESMEMENLQTGSRSKIEFDLSK